MLAYYPKIIDILKRCTTDEISQAEAEMKDLALDDLDVLSCLSSCLKDPTLDQALKTIATSHINSIFVTNITEYTQDFSLIYFKQLLRDPSIKMSNKKQISRALMYAIQQCDLEYLDKWKQFTYEVVLNPNTFEVGLILLTAFCCSEIKYNILDDLDQRVFPFSMDILTVELQNFTEHNATKVLQIYQVWKIIAEYLLNCQPDMATKTLSKWAKNEKLVQNLRFTYTQMSTGKGAHFLYLNQQILYQQVNDIKKVALQLHLIILQHLLQRYSKVKDTPLYQFTGLQIEVFVNTLCFVNYNENFQQQYDQEQIIITMLKIIQAICSQCPGIIYKSWKSMLHYVIFPFLALSEEQLADFEENTSSFIEITQDCCEKQKMGLLKTQAAKFMEKIADSSVAIQEVAAKMEGPNYQPVVLINGQTRITKYIINFAIASIKHHLQMQFFDKNQFFQQTHSQVPQSVKILSVETAFLILSIFSYCIDYYKKQVESIRVILCSDRSVNLPPIERTRIYAFLAYNYEQVFGLIHIKSLKFWINLALQENNQPTVQYCALDFISNTLNNYYDENQIKSIIQKIITNKSSNFWTLIKKIVLQHLIKFSQSLLINLVHESFKRIEIQLNSLHSQKIKMTHIITSLLQVLKIISEKGDFIQQKRELRKLLWESTKLYKLSISHYFQKEVVTIINCFLFYATKQEIQHTEMSKFIPEFVMDFIRNDYVPTHYYIAFNHFIMKGDFQAAVMPIYTVLKQSLNFFIGSLSNEVNRRKIPIAHTMLLLQNIITLYGERMPVQQLAFIRQIVKNVYPKKIEIKRNQKIKKKLSIYDRTILSRALNLQLICHIFNPLQSTITTILKYVQLKLFYGYDVSVIISCLYLLIRKQTRITILIQLLQLVINIIHKFMEMEIESKIEKINQEQRKEKKQLQFDDSDGGKIDQQHNQDRQSKKNAMLIRIQKISDYQSILAFIDTPFLKDEKKYINYSRCVKTVKDVRQQFIKELKKLYQANQALIESILGSYSQEIKYRIEVITQIKMSQILSGSLSKPMVQVQKIQRKKYTVKKVKQGYIQDTETNQGYNFTQQQLSRRQIHKLIIQNNQSQDEKQLLKRQRAQKKRKYKQNHQ